MNYTKLVFYEGTWPVLGKTLTIDFKRNEIELRSVEEGIRTCNITMAEGIAFKAKLELSHMGSWAEEYHPPVGVMVLDGNSWYLKLYNGKRKVKETHGCNGLPPGREWNVFYAVITRSCTLALARGQSRPDNNTRRPLF